MLVPSSSNPLTGLWSPQAHLKHVFYGSGCVKEHLLSLLPADESKVWVITGNSLATGTPVVAQVVSLLGSRHAGTTSFVRQHGPQEDIDKAWAEMSKDGSIKVVISIGGGSPIDTAKTLSFRKYEQTGQFFTHLTIPTTLSAAECTAGGGYTGPDGVKVGFMNPGMGVTAILYDPLFARHTPAELWLASGVRALDHAVECMYHPYASEMPWKALSLWAIGVIFSELPNCKDDASFKNGERDDSIIKLFLAAYASSGLKGGNFTGGMGLSHALGHALGSPYNIPHGITSCLTLHRVVELKVLADVAARSQILRILPALGRQPSGDDERDGLTVAACIEALVRDLGVDRRNLAERGVADDQISIIYQRSTRGIKDEKMLEGVKSLVEALFNTTVK
jgi:alcohol dehydrogenase class IV